MGRGGSGGVPLGLVTASTKVKLVRETRKKELLTEHSFKIDEQSVSSNLVLLL